MTLIGGELVDDGPDHVWLTNLDGQKIFQLPRSCIRESSRAEAIDRLNRDKVLAQLEKPPTGNN